MLVSLSLAENFRLNLSGGGGGSDLSRTRGFTLVSLLARHTREIIIACNCEGRTNERTKLGVVLWGGGGWNGGTGDNRDEKAVCQWSYYSAMKNESNLETRRRCRNVGVILNPD